MKIQRIKLVRYLWAGIFLLVSLIFAPTFAPTFAVAASASDSSNFLKLADSSVGPWVSGKRVRARLLADTAIEIEVDEGWTTYWRSPGQGGLPPKVDWMGYAGWQNIQRLEILFPVPKRLQVLGVEELGYRGNVIFPLKVTLADKNAPTSIALRLSLLVCKNICIPEKLLLTIDENASPESGIAARISQAVALLPTQAHQGHQLRASDMTISADGRVLELTIEGAEFEGFANDDFDDIFIESAPIKYVAEPRNLSGGRWRFTSEEAFAKNADFRLTLLSGKADKRAYEILGNTASARVMAQDLNASSSWLRVVFFAWLGGLMLNITPCVLPVMTLKVSSIASNLQGSARKMRLSLLVTAAGMAASLMLLAAVLALISYSGEFAGWGITFQQPAFLAFLLLVLALFSSNLLGVWQIPQPRLTDSRWQGDFATGALIGILGTPCLAPYLGAAAAFAFAGGPLSIMVVFLVVSLGMVTPYLLVAGFGRRALVLLPRPGAWLLTLKVISGVILLLVALWIASLINAVSGKEITASVVALAFLLVGACFLARKNRILYFAAALAMLAGVAVPLFAKPQTNVSKQANYKEQQEGLWQEYSPQLAAQLSASQQTYMIYVTAEWCVTCKVNESLVLNTQAFAKLFSDSTSPTLALAADWTKPNEEIENLLEYHQRYGIPFTIVFGPSAPYGIILSEILSISKIETALEQARGTR